MSIMMQQFVEACLASMDPKPARAYYMGTLAMFFTDNIYMTVRLTCCEAYEPRYVAYICEEWRRVCGGNHRHENQALNSGQYDGRVTTTSSSVS